MTPTRLVAILETMVAAIEEAGAVDQHARDPRAWLANRGLEARDAEALGTMGEQQFFVYRRLVRSTLASGIVAELSRTRALIEERFDADVEDFVSASLPRSHYLRDVAFDFVAFAGPRWKNDSTLPPFLHDLARYELVAYESAAARPPMNHPVRSSIEARIELAEPVLFDESVRLGRYDYPVHELPEDLPEGPPTLTPTPTALLVYRDRELDLRTLSLSPLAADIVEQLLTGATVEAAIIGAASAARTPLTPALLQDLATLLADYAERGILLGTVKPSAALDSQG